MKKFLLFISIIIFYCSCGILATIDPPNKNDFFNGKYDTKKFFSLDTNSIYYSFDTCGGSPKISLWQPDGKEKFSQFTFEPKGISEDSLFRIVFDVKFQQLLKSYKKRNYGYFCQLGKDTIKCELLNRITIGSFHFNCFDLFNIDTNSFNVKYTHTRPFKFRKSHWKFCSDTSYIYTFKKIDFNIYE